MHLNKPPKMLKTHKIGMLGIGKIGLAMARNMTNGGYSLSVYDKNPSSVAATKDFVSQIYDCPRELAKNSDILFSVLPNDLLIKDALLNETNGILSHLKPGSIHVCCSTISPHTSEYLS